MGVLKEWSFEGFLVMNDTNIFFFKIKYISVSVSGFFFFFLHLFVCQFIMTTLLLFAQFLHLAWRRSRFFVQLPALGFFGWFAKQNLCWALESIYESKFVCDHPVDPKCSYKHRVDHKHRKTKTLTFQPGGFILFCSRSPTPTASM